MAQITQISYLALKAQLSEPFEWPDGSAYQRTAGLVKVETDEGIVGWGPAAYGWAPSTLRALRELLIGRSALDGWAWIHERAARNLPLAVQGAVDVALWDIKGQLWGQPIYQLLGGALRHRVPAYATGGYYALPHDSLEWLREKVADAVARGFRAYKMKIGARSLEHDLLRVDAVREVLGRERKLAVDATTTYTLSLALRMGRELDQRSILWFEDPLPADDVEGYAHLSRSLDVPITAHYAANRPEVWGMLRRRAVAQVQPSIEAVGGYTRALQMIGMTALQRIVYDPSCWSTHLHMAATLHLLAIMPSPLTRLMDEPPWLEFDTSDNPLRERSVLTAPVTLNTDGTVDVPDGPGLGVQVDEDALAHFREE